MSITECNSVVPENVSRIIESRGLKRNAVANAAGYTPQHLSYMLNGRKIIKPCDILAISEALGVSVSDLFGTKRKRPGKSEQKSAGT